MLGDVIDWFIGRTGDRRQYKRRSGTFHLWWQAPGGGDPQPGMGLEISPNGMVFIHTQKIAAQEINVIARLDDVNIPIRMKTVRSDSVTQQGKVWNRYYCEITGVAADHWDAIVRYVNEEEVNQQDRRKMQNAEMTKQDDAYRLLPMAIQQKIISMLIKAHKLEAPAPGQQPLLKLFYGGLITKDGKKVHRVNVHSRIKVKDEMMAYDSRFLVSEDGEVTMG